MTFPVEEELLPSFFSLAAFLLADAGYDVWLANTRGSTYSRKHEKYQDTDYRFWDFTYVIAIPVRSVYKSV